MAQEYCLLEGIPYHLEEDCVFSKQMLHILEDSGIICRGICLLNKHTLYFPKGKLQFILTKMFFTSRGYFRVAINTAF